MKTRTRSNLKDDILAEEENHNESKDFHPADLNGNLENGDSQAP